MIAGKSIDKTGTKLGRYALNSQHYTPRANEDVFERKITLGRFEYTRIIITQKFVQIVASKSQIVLKKEWNENKHNLNKANRNCHW